MKYKIYVNLWAEMAVCLNIEEIYCIFVGNIEAVLIYFGWIWRLFGNRFFVNYMKV